MTWQQRFHEQFKPFKQTKSWLDVTRIDPVTVASIASIKSFISQELEKAREDSHQVGLHNGEAFERSRILGLIEEMKRDKNIDYGLADTWNQALEALKEKLK